VSEYQFYDFRAVDRALTQQQMSELREYSSRAAITPTSFQVVYHWGDFKGDALEWMGRYFDIHVYTTDWGTRELMLRIPSKLLGADEAGRYGLGEAFCLREAEDHLILCLRAEEVEGGWRDEEEDASLIPSLLPLRTDLMRGDRRCLYLGWLLSAQSEGIDEDQEPPVPPGLRALSPALEALVDFLGISPDWLQAAAEASPDMPDEGEPDSDIEQWIASLPAAEKDSIIARLIAGDEPHLGMELRMRAITDRCGARPASGSGAPGGRTVEQLTARSEELAAERKRAQEQRRAAEAQRKRREQAEALKRRLDALEGREDEAWARVGQLIATVQQPNYDQAVALLADLRALADRQGARAAFDARLSALLAAHAKKSALLRRMENAGLTGGPKSTGPLRLVGP